MKLPQLSLRDLFWLVALVAMGCGWRVDRSRLHSRNLELAAATTEAEHRGFLAGIDEVERWLTHEARKGDDARRLLGIWETESKSWILKVELEEFGEHVK